MMAFMTSSLCSVRNMCCGEGRREGGRKGGREGGREVGREGGR